MCRERINVTAVKLLQRFFVSQAAIELELAIVSPYQKPAAATGGIQYYVACFPNTKRIDDINDILIGIVLAKFVTFFRADQFLKYATQNVGRNLFKLKFFDCFYEFAPGLNRVGA